MLGGADVTWARAPFQFDPPGSSVYNRTRLEQSIHKKSDPPPLLSDDGGRRIVFF
jgi:hypothetical protein